MDPGIIPRRDPPKPETEDPYLAALRAPATQKGKFFFVCTEKAGVPVTHVFFFNLHGKVGVPATHVFFFKNLHIFFFFELE